MVSGGAIYPNGAQTLQIPTMSRDRWKQPSRCTSLLVHPKDKLRQQNGCECVYKIPCENCDKICIGETGRAFGVWLQEHR